MHWLESGCSYSGRLSLEEDSSASAVGGASPVFGGSSLLVGMSVSMVSITEGLLDGAIEALADWSRDAATPITEGETEGATELSGFSILNMLADSIASHCAAVMI